MKKYWKSQGILSEEKSGNPVYCHNVDLKIWLNLALVRNGSFHLSSDTRVQNINCDRMLTPPRRWYPLSGGSRISQRGVRQPQGALAYYLTNFSSKLHEHEKIPCAPLRSATAHCYGESWIRLCSELPSLKPFRSSEREKFLWCLSLILRYFCCFFNLFRFRSRFRFRSMLIGP